jgi:tRNA-specific 2-thiouridylase
MLFTNALSLTHIDWINTPPKLPANCFAKTRYRQADQACELRFDGTSYHVTFDEPQRAVTPGQSVVFYDGDQCLGGGVIEKRYNSEHLNT